MVKNTVLGTITRRLKQMTPEGLKAPIRTWLHSQRASRSQAGQDIWVLGEVFDGMERGFFLDIVAYDGIELRNSYLLETRYGWRGIGVEANPESFALLRRNRSAVYVNACLGAGDGHATFALDGMFGGIVSGQHDRANGSRPETVATDHRPRATPPRERRPV
jgi:hypothetical protein